MKLSKVKGQGFIPINKTLNVAGNYQDIINFNSSLYYNIVDPADYIIPPIEWGILFVVKFVKKNLNLFIKPYLIKAIIDIYYDKFH